DVDDVARITADHVGQQAAGHPHQADQIGLDDPGPIVRRARIEARPATDVVTGIVNEDVDRLEGVGDEIGQAVHGLGVGDVEFDGECVIAHFGGELGKGGGV